MDIVERLRAVSQGYVVFLNDHGVYTEAADEIERLRDALQKIVEFYDCLQSQKQEGDYDLLVWIARAALKEDE